MKFWYQGYLPVAIFCGRTDYTGTTIRADKVGSRRIVGPIGIFRVSEWRRQLYGWNYTGGPDSSRRIVGRQTLSTQAKSFEKASISIWPQLYGRTKMVPPYSWSLNSQYLESRRDAGADIYTAGPGWSHRIVGR